ncbi:hypothetical protein BD779DRAFT_1805172 [Infundibulicybe gibba]|nr:hypothetical protein BD779DRAFT_1805172 [Infundibulicybe gibba]
MGYKARVLVALIAGLKFPSVCTSDNDILDICRNLGKRYHLHPDLVYPLRMHFQAGVFVLLKIPEGPACVEIRDRIDMAVLRITFLPFYNVIIPVGLSIAIVLGTIVQIVGKGTYIFRMYRFGQNRYILACCCVLLLLELGLGLMWAGKVAISSTTQQVDAREKAIEWVITTQFAISAFIDVFVTVSVSYQLWRSRADGLKQTRYLIDKIMQWMIQTGMLTSAIDIAVVLTWNFNRDSPVWLGLSAFEPDCYIVFLLALLNARGTYSEATGSDHLSLPMAALSIAPEQHTVGASPDPGTAEDTTTAMVFDLRAPLDGGARIIV